MLDCGPVSLPFGNIPPTSRETLNIMFVEHIPFLFDGKNK